MISFLYAARLVSNTKAIEDTTANKNTILFYSCLKNFNTKSYHVLNFVFTPTK